ncbi:MAG: nucleotidyltransferase domain-containing protein [Nitrososphaera sp.]
MSSVSGKELEAIRRCLDKVAKGRRVAAACIYGSRVAGYARPDSDIDVLVVLEQYPHAIKYSYMREGGIDISALLVGRKPLEGDALSASLGEFAVGRLLHVYEPILNAELLESIERAYKRRVILEELRNIVDAAGTLSSELLFPLEYVLFSKVARRMDLYPSAMYSYYKTYAGSENSRRNLNHALTGYRKALYDIVSEDRQLFSRSNDLLQISDKRILVEKGKIRLKLVRGLQEFGSYLVQTYAGRRIMHLAIREAESKIRRHAGQKIELPDFMRNPKRAYWRLAEGRLITESRDWIDELARSKGIENYSVSHKRRLGNVSSRTLLYVVRHASGEFKIVAKELAKSKSVKWAALSLWTAPVKRFKIAPLLRLGTEYKAIRFLRSLGVYTPEIEAVVLDRKLIVTRFVEGKTLADVISGFIRGRNELRWLRKAGAQIAKIHNLGASLGNIKPKNIIVAERGLCFTDLDQFIFSPSDQVWDLAQFMSWGLKGTRSSVMARKIAGEFLQGYVQASESNANLVKLAKSRRYIESFLPVMIPSVARALKTEIRHSAG